ncbi:hypothetical protein LINPERPRIM_LOCUS40272, partial [Linum perenne]
SRNTKYTYGLKLKSYNYAIVQPRSTTDYCCCCMWKLKPFYLQTLRFCKLSSRSTKTSPRRL